MKDPKKENEPMNPNEGEEGIIMTPRLLETLKTENGGFTGATFLALDPDYKSKPSGWLRKLMWTRISMKQLEQARNGIGVYWREHRRRMRREAAEARQQQELV